MTKKIMSAMILIIIICIGINLYCYEIYASDWGFTIDGILNGADSFIEKGKNDTAIDETKLKTTSNDMFVIIAGIAMVTSVIVGMIIGIKFMVASIDEKAKVKEAIVPYVVGCAVAFGAIGIWKLAIAILSSW